MLENTSQTETKVPSTLALVAAKAAVEQERKYQEQVRDVIERQRAAERARALGRLNASREDDVQVSVGESNDAPAASTSDADAQPQQPPRGTAVDLNA